jgi:hypothetical protein
MIVGNHNLGRADMKVVNRRQGRSHFSASIGGTILVESTTRQSTTTQ